MYLILEFTNAPLLVIDLIGISSAINDEVLSCNAVMLYFPYMYFRSFMRR